MSTLRRLALIALVSLSLLNPSPTFAIGSFQVDSGGTLTTGLTSYWKQEDLTEFFVGGGTNDQTGTASPTFTSGQVGNALTLNGSSQYTTVPSGSFVPNSQTYSIALWFKINSGSAFYILGTEHTTGSNQIWLDYNNNIGGALSFGKIVSGNYSHADYTWTADNNWHFVVITQDATNGMKMYFDGNTTPVATSANTTAPTVDSWEFGSAFGLNSPFPGQIDEIAAWSKTLTTTEITDLWNGGAGQTMTIPVVASANLMQVVWID